MAASDCLDPQGYWLDPDRNIHREGNEDGEQEVIVSAWQDFAQRNEKG